MARTTSSKAKRSKTRRRPADERRLVIFGLTTEERAAITARAEQEGRTVSMWGTLALRARLAGPTDDA